MGSPTRFSDIFRIIGFKSVPPQTLVPKTKNNNNLGDYGNFNLNLHTKFNLFTKSPAAQN